MPDIYTIVSAKAGMHYEPASNSKLHHELLRGETFSVLEDHGNWLKGRAVYDGYEGYIYKACARPKSFKPTHKLVVPRSHLYPVNDFKALPLQSAYFMSSYYIPNQEPSNGFLQTQDQKWIFANHLALIDVHEADHVKTALNFIHTPYLWGGRSVDGIDCAALVQLSIAATGAFCERDTKDQINTLGREVKTDNLKRGDVVFFSRHVGIMVSPNQILNATSRHMSTVIEDIETLKSAYGEILAARRLEDYCPG